MKHDRRQLAASCCPPLGDDLREALRAYEGLPIQTVLRRKGDDKRAAADALGLWVSSLYGKIDELDLERP